MPVPVGVFDREPEGLEVLTAEAIPLPDWLTIFPTAGVPPEWIVADKVRHWLMESDRYRQLVRERNLWP